MAAKLREYLVLGLLSVAPIAITIWVLWTAIRMLDNLVPPSLQAFPGLGFILCFFILLTTGVIVKTFGSKLFSTVFDTTLSKVPVIRGLYSVSKQISQSLFSKDKNKSFKRVVMIPFLSTHAQTLGFVTGEISAEKKLFVFVPTAPNPTSGYVLILNESDVQDCPYTVDEAFKIVISCGATVHI
jgi:uncharacterized membrane protein